MTAMQDTAQHTLQDFTDRILQASKSGQALRLRGGGTKDFLGQSLQGEVLDTTAYSGILSYEPSELVITVRCGTPFSGRTIAPRCVPPLRLSSRLCVSA